MIQACTNIEHIVYHSGLKFDIKA